MSDSLESLDDDWILDIIASQEKEAPKAPRPPQPPSAPSRADDEIVIPAVFLTQGEKNTRLLRQNNEILRQIQSEDERMRQQLEHVDACRRCVLAELNDNGSQYAYSMKNDARVVEEHLQLQLAHDASAVLRRHFYYFADVQRPPLAVDVSPATAHLLTDMALALTPRLLQRHLRGSSLADFVLAALATAQTVPALRLVERFLVHALSTKSVEIGVPTTDFGAVMTAIGAQPSPVLLKLVQYRNGDPELVVLRASIAFRLYVRLLRTEEQYLDMMRHFALTCSDYILCKTAKEPLLTFMEPVFSALVHWQSKHRDENELVAQIHDIFAIKACIYGQETPEPQKSHELHFNLLHNLHAVLPQNTVASKILTKLMLRFLSDGECSAGVADLATIIDDIGKFQVSRDGTDTIFKNYYRAQLLSSILVHKLYRQEDTDDFVPLYQVLLTCKDNLQQSIAQLLFVKTDELANKAQISTALTDTYHVLDHLGTVLGKNLVFLRRDIFYEETPL